MAYPTIVSLVTAIVFPGQGSQTPGMGESVRATAPDLHELACELVGEDPFERVDESTRFAQPAIAAAGLAAHRRLQETEPAPAVLAGHSLGELPALAAAGVLSPYDALALVARRGALMADAENAAPGAMAALLGGEPEAAEALATQHGVSLANDNGAGQFVLSGDRDAIAAVTAAAPDEGWRVLPLAVSGAYHSPAMAPARAGFAAALEQIDFRAPAVPVYSSATAAPFRDPARELADAVVSPVRWREVQSALRDDVGIERIVDAGPGRVLAKLAKRTLPGIDAVTAEAIGAPA
jgi:[acyl-carrier-protein] S-malonyltransferase